MIYFRVYILHFKNFLRLYKKVCDLIYSIMSVIQNKQVIAAINRANALINNNIMKNIHKQHEVRIAKV